MLKVYRHSKEARIPTKAYPTDAGFDVYSIEDLFIKVGTTAKVRTGITVECPEGYWIQIQTRSGMAEKGLKVGAGVVDANYVGELNVILHNISYSNYKNFRRGYNIKKGDRIAQIIFHKMHIMGLYEVSAPWDSIGRGTNGFGSTGN